MKLVDTNVVLALLVDDRPDAAAKAMAEIQAAAAAGERLVVCESVLAETIWVLKAVYGYAASEMAEMLLALLDTELTAWDGVLAERALRLMAARPRLDIVDCLLAAKVAVDGAELLTFDRSLRREV